MKFGAHSVGITMLLCVLFAVWHADRFGFDPENLPSPEAMFTAIIPALAFLAMAWWLVFR